MPRFTTKPAKVVDVHEPKYRAPYYTITGHGVRGYNANIVDESLWTPYGKRSVSHRTFSWGRKRAERWAKRELAWYLRQRQHQEYKKVGYAA